MPTQDQGTATSGFGVIPDEIKGILFSVMAEKYYKALESGSRSGLTNDEWVVLTSLRNNYGTFNFASSAFKAMLEPLPNMGIDEIAGELNSRQRVIPPFGTPEYSEYRRQNPLPPAPTAGSQPPAPATTTTTTVPPTTTAAPTTTTPTSTPSYPTSDPYGRPTEGPGFGRNVPEPPAPFGESDLDASLADAAARGGVATTPAMTTPATTTTTTAGGGGGGIVVEEPAKTGIEGVPTSWQEAAAELYPEYWLIVQNIPEIADLLKTAYEQKWEPGGAKFQAALEATNWWQTTTASARQWDINSQRDPATYNSYIDVRATEINQAALTKGIRLSDVTARDLALKSLRNGWSEQMILDSIGLEAVTAGPTGMTQLLEGYYGQQMRRYLADYGVTLADTTFNSFLNRIAVGNESLDSFQDYALSMAKTLYPALTQQFDAGKTFEDAVGGYRQIAANTLEVDPMSIDFMDPMWATAVTYQPDPATGEQRMMNLQEWGDYLRNTPTFGYEYTEQAKSRAYQVIDRLANLFGRV